MSLPTRRPLGLLLGFVLATAAIAVAVSALAGPKEDATGSAPSYRPAHAAVCRAADATRRGDARQARAVFFDDAHQALHELADASQARDRATAARLLEAKGRVESGLERPGPTLADDLDALASATARAMVAAGATDPGPCPR